MWVKEMMEDSEICAEHCCRSGFDRAGISRALYGEPSRVDVDGFIPPPVCVDCGELGEKHNDQIVATFPISILLSYAGTVFVGAISSNL